MIERLYHKGLNLYKKYKETILYLFFGGLTTLINIAAYWLLSGPAGIDYLAANAVAWILSVLFAFVTNKLFVFASRDLAAKLVLKELTLFVGARLFSGALDMGTMYLFIDILHCNDMLIKIVSNVIVVVVNYVLSKLIIFRKKA
ncbi:MAG: GtrA family protein [Acetanaerobacterium sp.]